MDINNSSGHYGPKRHCLHRAVEILKDEGTDLRYLRVGLHGVGYFTADAFLKNATQPDWPEQDIKKLQNPIFQAKGLQL
jgi:hypothetical protein